jgi:hypothetical protein
VSSTGMMGGGAGGGGGGAGTGGRFDQRNGRGGGTERE